MISIAGHNTVLKYAYAILLQVKFAIARVRRCMNPLRFLARCRRPPRCSRSLLPRCTIAVSLSILLVADVGIAQEANTNLFHAAAPLHGYFSQESAQVAELGEFHAGATFDLGSDLLVVRDPMTGAAVMDGEIVGQRAALHLAAGVGVLRRLELGISLSTAVQSGDSSPFRPALRSAALGDLRLRGKARLWRRGAASLASSLELSLPTASNRSFFGDSHTAATATVILGIERRGWSVSAQSGYRLRSADSIGDLVVNDEFIVGLAARYPIKKDRVWVQAEMYGAVGIEEKGNAMERPVETIAGIRTRAFGRWIIQAGFGFGITQGYGTAQSRGILSIGLVPQPPRAMLARTEWTPADEPADVADIRFEEPPASPVIRVVGDRIVLPASILFDVGGDEIKPEGRAVLKQVIDLWRDHPEWASMSIEGHTDVRGSQSSNQQLSERRAINVRSQLIELGGSSDAISASGLGESRPLAAGLTDADHARNRRVEFVITQRQIKE
jgi:outer membrane protein OmpA-like peptidoglycan-associated protein